MHAEHRHPRRVLTPQRKVVILWAARGAAPCHLALKSAEEQDLRNNLPGNNLPVGGWLGEVALRPAESLDLVARVATEHDRETEREWREMINQELADATWFRSSFSGTHGNCVEVAILPDAVVVRDSKNPDGPTLTFTPDEWEAFVAGAKNGEFDRLAHREDFLHG